MLFKPIRWGTFLIAVLVVAVAARYVSLQASHQWDFETYYYAAVAARAGLDPYSLSALTSVAGKPVELPYLYAPATLPLFFPLTNLPITVASAVWLGLKCLLAGLLLRLWARVFVPDVPVWLLVVVTLLGFDLALLWDFRTGNVSLVEQILLWLAFAAHVRGRAALTAGFIVAAALFKLYPITYLVILLLPVPTWKRFGLVSVALLSFGALLAIPAPNAGSWFDTIRAFASAKSATPGVDPSALTIIRWVLGNADGCTPVGVYLTYVALLLGVSVRFLTEDLRSRGPRAQIASVVLLWFLLSPRVMVYSYVGAIAPTLFILRSVLRGPTMFACANLILVGEGVMRLLPGAVSPWIGAGSYACVLLTWLLWIRADGSAEPATPSSHGTRRPHLATAPN